MDKRCNLISCFFVFLCFNISSQSDSSSIFVGGYPFITTQRQFLSEIEISNGIANLSNSNGFNCVKVKSRKKVRKLFVLFDKVKMYSTDSITLHNYHFMLDKGYKLIFSFHQEGELPNYIGFRQGVWRIGYINGEPKILTKNDFITLIEGLKRRERRLFFGNSRKKHILGYLERNRAPLART